MSSFILQQFIRILFFGTGTGTAGILGILLFLKGFKKSRLASPSSLIIDRSLNTSLSASLLRGVTVVASVGEAAAPEDFFLID
jgi:hypothetical protein